MHEDVCYICVRRCYARATINKEIWKREVRARLRIGSSNGASVIYVAQSLERAYRPRAKMYDYRLSLQSAASYNSSSPSEIESNSTKSRDTKRRFSSDAASSSSLASVLGARLINSPVSSSQSGKSSRNLLLKIAPGRRRCLQRERTRA